MAPIYERVFAIKYSELEDPQFLGRLRRSGLDDSMEEGTRKKKKGKKGR
jgi:hypothetical protein